eukprot:7380415-Prymnesium_polylepis.1
MPFLIGCTIITPLLPLSCRSVPKRCRPPPRSKTSSSPMHVPIGIACPPSAETHRSRVFSPRRDISRK